MPMPSAPGAGVAPSSASRRAAVVAAAPVAEIPSAPKVKPQPTASQIVASVASPVASPAIGGKKGAVQLASFPDKAVAEQAVGKMQAKYSAYLGGARLRVVEADLGAKGIYYRIQSESLSESQARKICSSLKTLKAGCLFVRP